MKTKQVRSNRSAARPSPQAKNTRNHKPQNVRIVTNDEAGKAIADFEIPKASHAAMQRAASRAGVSLWEWMQSAVRERIAASQPKENPPAPRAAASHFVIALGEMEAATAQSHALHMLFHDVITSEQDGGYGEEISYGISELVCQTHDRMHRAMAAVETLVNGKTEVAS